MANIETFDVISEADGLKLSVAAIKPVEPIGVVQLAHGMAENKERYYDLMQYLTHFQRRFEGEAKKPLHT